jgi:hypothetical protein
LQQQFQLVFVQTFIALTTEVMADILVELLAQQPVLLPVPTRTTRALNSSTF